VRTETILSEYLTFEPAVDSDAAPLAEIRVRAMQPSLERIGRFDPQRARDRFLSGFCAANTYHVVVAGINVGFFVLKQHSPGVMLLDHLYIQPEQQNRGIGSTVLREVIYRAMQRKCSLRVGALKKSDSNRFYTRHGFVLTEQTENDNYYVYPYMDAQSLTD